VVKVGTFFVISPEMNNKLIIFLLTIASACSIQGIAQKPTDLIEDLNNDLLDSLIFEEVNKRRLEIKQAKLYLSETLTLEAKEHSTEMVKANEIYYQEKSGIGECILAILVIQFDVTYQDLAIQIVERWLNSPGHYDLLMTQFFTDAGVGSAHRFSEEIGIELKVSFRLKYL
jgi:uncharacterized protein YkwD